MYIPEGIILSAPRSGTHLLLSFLTKHPEIHGKGEMFLHFRRHKTLKENIEGKTNVAILMYHDIPVFLSLGGNLSGVKIIHLLRNPRNVALSMLQMAADKIVQGSAYQAHYHEAENFQKRGTPDLTELDYLTEEVSKSQQRHIEMLNTIGHLEVHYEDLCKDIECVKLLNDEIKTRLLSFLNIEGGSHELYTTYVKTGIVLE